MAKILIAEDDRLLAQQLERLLRFEHHVVEAVNDGADAIDFLVANSYDMLILDWELPSLHGPAILKEIKERNINLNIIMLTGRTSVADKEIAFSSGVQDFVSKPFSGRELVARINAILRRRQVATSVTLTMGNLSIDPETRTVNAEGKEIHLFPKEFDLLVLLIQSAGASLSTESIMERISSRQPLPLSSLRTYIKSLRKKLESANCNVTIKTDRGSGYCCQLESDK